MSVLPSPAPTAAEPGRADAGERVAALVDALRGERELIERLAGVLARQRRAVATHDLGALEDTSFAAHRILPNLTQAQRRRRSLAQLLCGGEGEDLPLTRLGGAVRQALGGTRAAELDAAISDLQETAARLSDELRVNRGVLEGALATGDRLIRALGGAGRAPAVYRRTDDPAEPIAGGRLVDRQA